MLIEHETAPSIALKILRTGIFLGGPIMGDAGLNAVPQGGVGYWADQAEWSGAIMTFEWNGQLAGKTPYQPAPDMLYDDKPHRVFIPVGTRKHLMLKEIRLKQGFTWAECFKEYDFPSGLEIFNLTKWSNAIRSRTEAGKRDQIKNIECCITRLALEPKPIRICAHDHNW